MEINFVKLYLYFAFLEFYTFLLIHFHVIYFLQNFQKLFFY